MKQLKNYFQKVDDIKNQLRNISGPDGSPDPRSRPTSFVPHKQPRTRDNNHSALLSKQSTTLRSKQRLMVGGSHSLQQQEIAAIRSNKSNSLPKNRSESSNSSRYNSNNYQSNSKHESRGGSESKSFVRNNRSNSSSSHYTSVDYDSLRMSYLKNLNRKKKDAPSNSHNIHQNGFHPQTDSAATSVNVSKPERDQIRKLIDCIKNRENVQNISNTNHSQSKHEESSNTKGLQNWAKNSNLSHSKIIGAGKIQPNNHNSRQTSQKKEQQLRPNTVSVQKTVAKKNVGPKSTSSSQQMFYQSFQIELTDKKSQNHTKNPITLYYSYRTKQGFLSTNPKKVNQDSLLVKTNMLQKNMHLFAVADGHGMYGHQISQLVAKNLAKCMEAYLKNTSPEESFQLAFNRLQQMISESTNINSTCSGSTLVSVLIKNDEILCANAGDSRAILARQSNFDLFTTL